MADTPPFRVQTRPHAMAPANAKPLPVPTFWCHYAKQDTVHFWPRPGPGSQRARPSLKGPVVLKASFMILSSLPDVKNTF